MENEKEITLVRTFDASREKVWKAWTNKEELQKWWGPHGVTIPTSEMDLRVGGRLYIVMLAGEELGPMAGQHWPMQGVFKEIIPPGLPANTAGKLVFTNEALDEAGNILLQGLTTATFEDEEGKTKLTVTTGAKGLVPQAPQMLAGMEMGWNQQLDKLGTFLGQ